MMKKLVVFTLILGLASGAQAALTLVTPPGSVEVGQTVTIKLNSSTTGGYSGWLEIEDPTIVNFAGDPALTAEGNPAGASSVKGYPTYGAWYQFMITSTDPTKPIVAGDHLLVNLTGVKEGATKLNLYAENGIKLLQTVTLTAIPEPATIALLGLGGLLLARRRK